MRICNTMDSFRHRCHLLGIFLLLCFLNRSLVFCIERCGRELCRSDQVCCAPWNDTCCRQFIDKTYYNIAMVTRKLSGVLIMLLLFAVGYFVQRMLCSRSRPLAPPQNGHPTVTSSQDPLVDICTPDGLADPVPAAQLPTYEECKRLPTYEETVRDGYGARAGTSRDLAS